jgi:hypothetical protein
MKEKRGKKDECKKLEFVKEDKKGYQKKDNKRWKIMRRNMEKVNIYLSSLMMKVPDHVYVLG